MRTLFVQMAGTKITQAKIRNKKFICGIEHRVYPVPTPSFMMTSSAHRIQKQQQKQRQH